MVNLAAAALVQSLVLSLAIPPPSAGDPNAMTDDERMSVAKTLFDEGAELLDAERPLDALAKYEEAYHHYATDLHVFNYNIGWAAFEAGQCDKAQVAFRRFVDMVSEHDDRATAQEQLLAIERGECVSSGAPTTPAVATTTAPGTTTTTTPNRPTGPTADDNADAPILKAKSEERKKIVEVERAQQKRRGMLFGGIVATSVGGLSLIGGAISLGLANNKANELADLASPGPTGFPDGNYSSDDVFGLDRNRLPANNAATIGLFVGGGVVTAVGATLIGLDVRNHRRTRGLQDEAAAKPRTRLVGVGASPSRGGLKASATLVF